VTPSSSKARLTGVWAFAKDLVYVRAAVTALDDQEVDHSAMLRFDGREWSQYMIPAGGVAHCAIPENQRTVLTLSPEGAVHVAKPDGFGWEILDESPDGPNSLRQMRDIRPIEDHVYAVGMGRMVYRRSSGGHWERFDNGMRGDRSAIEISGLLGIDGCSESYVYAVGFRGELWRYDGSRWNAVDSPTNLKLERVRVISSDLAVACGAAGTILVGSGDQWRSVSQTLTRRTFWGLEYFQGLFYLADGKAIYVFDGEVLSQMDLVSLGPVAMTRLHAADEMLWSVGERDVIKFDGSTLTRVALSL
jgi:hypothetical protein